jgi:hypothetical protein
MNELEKRALKLQKFDPLHEAEKEVGPGKEASVLGFVLLQHLSAQKEDVFSVLGDTHCRMPYTEYVQTLERHGFEKIYTETHGEKNDVYEIWWRADGFLVTSESYDQKSVNTASVYYNWMPSSVEAAYATRSSGGYVAPGVWSGYADGREGLFTHLKQLRENGQVLPSWVEPPFLWLLNYTEPKVEGYDYKVINRVKFSVFPAHVQKAIGLVKA